MAESTRSSWVDCGHKKDWSLSVYYSSVSPSAVPVRWCAFVFKFIKLGVKKWNPEAAGRWSYCIFSEETSLGVYFFLSSGRTRMKTAKDKELRFLIFKMLCLHKSQWGNCYYLSGKLFIRVNMTTVCYYAFSFHSINPYNPTQNKEFFQINVNAYQNQTEWQGYVRRCTWSGHTSFIRLLRFILLLL